MTVDAMAAAAASVDQPADPALTPTPDAVASARRQER